MQRTKSGEPLVDLVPQVATATAQGENYKPIMSYDDWSLTIGEVVAPFGLAGEMKVRLETDFPERFKRLPQVCLRWKNGEARLFDVEGTRLHKGQILLKLRGVTAIEGVEPLRNTLVQVRSDDAVRLPADEFYIYELVGCDVVTDEGTTLGKLLSILRTGANDVYIIQDSEKREILLPAIKDVVRTIELEQRRIVVTPTPGLLPGEAEEA